jgi:virulence factor Mce-like protein
VKRVVALLIVFTAVFAAMAAVLLLPGHSGYHVDAIFNDVDFLIPGQQVRIAGATVGQVESIKLTKNLKARVEMVLGNQYAPFRSNANCEVEPQSLIGDRYVNCTPGTPQYPALKAQGGEPPTLPVSSTNSPVDLDLVLQTLNLPTRERAALLIDSLGVGLTAQGGDLNQAIMNANPALQETQRVLSILNQNRAQLQSLIDGSDTVLGRLATSRSRVQAFVRNSATILSTTAANRSSLEQAVVRLPPLLEQVRPTLAALDAFAKEGTPASTELDAAAPGLNSLLGQLQGFAPQVLPTIEKLGTTANTLQAALPSITPQVQRLRSLAAEAPAAGELVSALFTSLRSSGAADGLLEFVYYAAAAFARYDNISHILPAYELATLCSVYAMSPSPGCNAHFASYNAASDKASGAHARRTGAALARHGGSAHAPTRTKTRAGPTPSSGTHSAPASGTTTTTTTTTTSAPPPPTQPNPLAPLLKFLLGG